MRDSFVLWFTGLSGSGKTTIANGLSAILNSWGKTVIVLDGDVLRNTIHKHLKFTPQDIKKNNELIAKVCVRCKKQYDYVLVPVISPFAESRQKAKDLIGKNFIEIYVKASLDTVIKRDIKGLYSRALRGEIQNFIGIDPYVPYEAPENPDIVLETETEDVNILLKKLINYLKGRRVSIV